jgi:hypothetical protein
VLTFIAVVACIATVVNAVSRVYQIQRSEKVHAEERRFLINHIIAKTPTEFAVLQSAARPDDTVEAVAEARGSKPERPLPLGL